MDFVLLKYTEIKSPRAYAWGWLYPQPPTPNPQYMDPWIWTCILIMLGIVFAVLELLVPSGGLLAFFSFASFCASVVFAFHQGMVFGIAFLVVLLIGLPILIWQLILVWPYTPIGRKMLLDPESDPALAPNENAELFQNLVGKIGVAKTPMFPSGIISIDGTQYDALSEGEPVEPGMKVVVVKANQLNIVVRIAANEITLTKPSEDAPPIDIEDPF